MGFVSGSKITFPTNPKIIIQSAKLGIFCRKGFCYLDKSNYQKKFFRSLFSPQPINIFSQVLFMCSSFLTYPINMYGLCGKQWTEKQFVWLSWSFCHWSILNGRACGDCRSDADAADPLLLSIDSSDRGRRCARLSNHTYPRYRISQQTIGCDQSDHVSWYIFDSESRIFFLFIFTFCVFCN